MTRLLVSLAMVLLEAGAARAGLVTITPYSISQPPVNDSWSYTMNDLVINQYRGLGLAFRYDLSQYDSHHGEGFSTIIETQGSGVHAWVGAHVIFDDPSPVQVSNGMHLVPVVADLVVPGTQVPATTDLLRVKLSSSGWPSMASVYAYDRNGKLLLSVSGVVGDGQERWFSLQASGIHSFSASAYWLPAPVTNPKSPPIMENAPPWGVVAVAFAETPEPSGLVLCGLGALGLTGFARKRS